jgi:hypothetical protein
METLRKVLLFFRELFYKMLYRSTWPIRPINIGYDTLYKEPHIMAIPNKMSFVEKVKMYWRDNDNKGTIIILVVVGIFYGFYGPGVDFTMGRR